MSTSRHRSPLRLAGLAAAFALVPPASAQFVGDYLFDGPSVYLYSGDGYEYAAWSIEAVMDGAGVTEGAVWTMGLPDSVILEANAVSTVDTLASVRMTTTASVVANTTGNLGFSFSSSSEGNGAGGFFYTVWDADGNRTDSPVYGGSQSFSITLQPNYGFAFNVFAEDLTADLDDHDFFSATITDFSFTPIPEPSAGAAFAAFAAVACVAWRRRGGSSSHRRARAR